MPANAPSSRLLLVALATAVAVSAFAGSASGRAAGVAFTSSPSRIVQGNQITMNLSVNPAGARCSLSVRYKTGARQKGLSAITASGGHASWTWRVPRSTKPGPARATASCAGAGSATKSFVVIGQVIPPKIHVVKSGWSVRVHRYGGSTVSYGVILANDSKDRDALDVKVLVNFVMDDNRLIGSASSRISDISAGSEHAFGGDLSFPGGAPIARLEITVEVGKGGPVTRTKPGLSQIRVMPAPLEPEWVGSIEGEVQNDHKTRTLQSVQLSGVVLDAEGNVIGGATGFGFGTLPPAAREFFKISGGLRAIPYYKAATALVSVIPRYKRQ